MSLTVARVADGLWTWQTGGEPRPPDRVAARPVSSVYHEAPEHVVLVDPQLPVERTEEERFIRHLDADLARHGRPLAVVLTSRRHAGSAEMFAARYGARIVQAADESERGEVLPGVVRVVVGDAAPGESVIHLSAARAVVFGDVIVGATPGGVRWGAPRTTVSGDALVLARVSLLDRLAALDVDVVLVAHVAGVGEAAATDYAVRSRSWREALSATVGG